MQRDAGSTLIYLAVSLILVFFINSRPMIQSVWRIIADVNGVISLLCSAKKFLFYDGGKTE